MKKSIILLISMVMISCATVSPLRPTETNLAIMQQKVPGINLEEAQKGFKLYKFNCSGCHYLPRPDVYTISRWETILPVMLGRAKITSETEAKLIKDYLFAKSK
jgi:cytochrome c1